MGDAARLHLNGLDAARYLGIEPAQPLDDVARTLMVKLNNRIVSESDRLASRDG
jgi:hypothetical protein